MKKSNVQRLVFEAMRISNVSAIVRTILRKVLPEGLRRRVHYFRQYKAYTILRTEALGYQEDGLFTFNAAPFMGDERFQRAYEAGALTNSWHGADIRWRAFVACWAGDYAVKLEGDFLECGVNRGGLATAVVEYTNFGAVEKEFFLVDTFNGLVPEMLTQAEREKDFLGHYAYYQDNSKDMVIRNFARFRNVKIVQGVVPQVLPDIPVRQLSYLSLDMNCTIPEIEAAEFFWDRIVSSGLILLDDYGQKMHREQQIAFDEFARKRGVTVLALPTGQGLIFKA